MVFQGVENFVHRPSVGNLKLIITFILNIIHMTSDSGADTCRDLGCCDIYQIITDTLALSGGYGNTCKRHKQTICTDYLQKLWFVDILRVNPVVVDDRTKSRAGKSDLCMWIFSLQKICVISRCKSILAEIIQSQKCRKTNTSHAAF